MKKIILATLTLASIFSTAGEVAPTTSDIQEVNTLLADNTVRATYNYCINGTLTCRQLVLYKDKVTGQNVESFSNIFVAAERAVGSTGYFVKKANGKFRATLDDIFNGVVLPNKKYTENEDLTITFDNQGLPTVHNLQLFRLGTTRYSIAEMSFSNSKFQIVGTEYDHADPNFQQAVNIIYNKVN
jgi:hypothetical protein